MATATAQPHTKAHSPCLGLKLECEIFQIFCASIKRRMQGESPAPSRTNHRELPRELPILVPVRTHSPHLQLPKCFPHWEEPFGDCPFPATFPCRDIPTTLVSPKRGHSATHQHWRETGKHQTNGCSWIPAHRPLEYQTVPPDMPCSPLPTPHHPCW